MSVRLAPATALASVSPGLLQALCTDFVEPVREAVFIIKGSSLDSIQFTLFYGLRAIRLDHRFKDQRQIVTTRNSFFAWITILVYPMRRGNKLEFNRVCGGLTKHNEMKLQLEGTREACRCIASPLDGLTRWYLC